MAHTKKNKTNTPKPITTEPIFNTVKVFVAKNRFIIILGLVFMVTCIALAYTWYGQQINADALSYFTIAEKYARGDIGHAVNGYWGPMLSWLLVPAVWMGIGLSAFAKVVLSFAGLGIIIVTYQFLRQRQVHERINKLVTTALAIIIMDWAILGLITPDLIMAFFVLIFAIKLIDFSIKPSSAQAIILGAVGTLMYFTKAFGLFLFLSVIIVLAIWQWLGESQKPKVILMRYAPMIITFFLLASPFVAALTHKYHALTFDTTAAYNKHVYISGPYQHDRQPLEYMGPVAPPNDTAASPWEDPTYLTANQPDWNPMFSTYTLNYYINNIFLKDVRDAIAQVWAMGAFVTAGFLALITYCFQRKRLQRDFIIFTLISVLTFAGYCIVFVTARYLWGTAVLAVIALGLTLDIFYKRKAMTLLQIAIAGVLICGSMLWINVQALNDYKNPDADQYVAAMSLKKTIPKGSKIVSDTFPDSYYPCYYLKLHCYNLLAPPSAMEQPAYYRQLKNLGVQYFVNYHTKDEFTDLHLFVNTYFVPVERHVSGVEVITTYKLK